MTRRAESKSCLLLLWMKACVMTTGVAIEFRYHQNGTRIGKADELPVHNRKGVGNQTNRGRVHLVMCLLAKVTTKFGPPLPPSPPSPKGGKGGKITLLLYNIVVIFWF